MKGRRVLVTGGAGFIGSHLVAALLARGARVRVLDDLSTGERENLPVGHENLELLEGDLRSATDCKRAAQGVEAVFHQGALGSVPRSMADPATTIAVNTTGTANLFAAVRDEGLPGLVYASSSSVYGADPRLPRVEGQEGPPLSPYALSKRMGEQLAEVFAASFGMRLVGLRYFNVFGPRQSPEGPYAAVIPRFFACARDGRQATIHGDGSQSRDFTAVEDAIEANLLAASKVEENAGEGGGWSRVYNVGSGRASSVLDVFGAIARLAGGAPEPTFAPPRPGDVAASLADLTAIERDLGYRPRWTLEEGLERARAHYLESAPDDPRKEAST